MSAPRFSRKCIRDLARELRRRGCEVLILGNGHVLIRHPNGERLSIAGTPRAERTDRWKVASWLRQMGEPPV